MLQIAKTYHKPVYGSYTSRSSDPDACAESKILRHSSLDFYFSLSLRPSFFSFLAHFFYFAGHLVGFILMGRVFRKAFRILGLGERKGRRAIEQDFHGDLPFSPVSLIEFWYGLKDLVTLHKVADKVGLDR